MKQMYHITYETRTRKGVWLAADTPRDAVDIFWSMYEDESLHDESATLDGGRPVGLAATDSQGRPVILGSPVDLS